MLKILLLALMLLMAALPAQAEWIKVETTAKSGETHYFDLETVQKDGAYRRVWTLSSYDEPQPGGYRSIKTLYQFDCSDGKARAVTILLYPDKTAETTVTGAHHDENRDWFDYSPQSVLGEIVKAICKD